MKHCMQDAATDLGVELPFTKRQCTAFMKEGVPRLRMKAAVMRHLLLVLLRMIEIHFPPLRRPRPPSLLVPLMSLPRVRGIPQLVGEAIAAKGTGTFPQARRTLHVACVESVSSWDSCGSSGARNRSITQCITCSIRLGTLHSSGITVTSQRLAGPVMSQKPCTCRCSLELRCRSFMCGSTKYSGSGGGE